MNKNFILKLIFVVVTVAVALGLIWVALEETVPELVPLIEKGNADDIQKYLRESSTFKGILCTALLQMVQVWSLFIAGMPIQVAAGCVYGLAIAFLICHLSSVLAQLIAIIVWRRMGQRLEKWLPVDTGKNSRFNDFLNAKAPPAYIVILACLIPVLPNGLIALMASKMDISVGKYTASVWAGSIINVLLCCAVGNRIIQGDWGIALLFVLILVTIFLLMWFLRDRILNFSQKVKNDVRRELL